MIEYGINKYEKRILKRPSTNKPLNKNNTLDKNIVKCPKCSVMLEFRMINGHKMIVDNMYNAFCHRCSTYYNVTK